MSSTFEEKRKTEREGDCSLCWRIYRAYLFVRMSMPSVRVRRRKSNSHNVAYV